MTGLPILCVGALTMDTIFEMEALPLSPGKFLPLRAVEAAAGMAASQAASIVRLGHSAALWASVGDDDTGRRVVAEIGAEGVDCSAVRIVPGARSALSTILIEPAGERIIVPYYDPALRTDPQAVPEISGFSAVMVDVRWPSAAAIALAAARQAGIPGILDADVAPAAVLDMLLPLASHIVSSAPAAAAATGQPGPDLATVELARRYPSFVAVTAGGEGAFWFDRYIGALRHCPAPEVTARDTLAAGDVFHAGFAVGLLEGRRMDDIMTFASMAAAIKCSRFGGRLGAPNRAELDAALASASSRSAAF